MFRHRKNSFSFFRLWSVCVLYEAATYASGRSFRSNWNWPRRFDLPLYPYVCCGQWRLLTNCACISTTIRSFWCIWPAGWCRVHLESLSFVSRHGRPTDARLKLRWCKRKEYSACSLRRLLTSANVTKSCHSLAVCWWFSTKPIHYNPLDFCRAFAGVNLESLRLSSSHMKANIGNSAHRLHRCFWLLALIHTNTRNSMPETHRLLQTYRILPRIFQRGYSKRIQFGECTNIYICIWFWIHGLLKH